MANPVDMGSCGGGGSSVAFSCTDLATCDTDDLAEGSNLYYTNERVDDRVAALLQDGGGLTWTYNDSLGTLTPAINHANLSNLTSGDPHTQYRLEADNHTHQSSGAQAGQLDHGAALTGLSDDDHSLYLLASDATNRSTFATNWTDLTDGGTSSLHSHTITGTFESFHPFLLSLS